MLPRTVYGTTYYDSIGYVTSRFDQRYLHVYNSESNETVKTDCLINDEIYADIKSIKTLAAQHIDLNNDEFIIVQRCDIFPRREKVEFDIRYPTLYICVKKCDVYRWNKYCQIYAHGLELYGSAEHQDPASDSESEQSSCNECMSPSYYDSLDEEEEMIKFADQRYLYVFTDDDSWCTETNCLLEDGVYGDPEKVRRVAAGYLGINPGYITIVERKNGLPRREKSEFDEIYDKMYICVKYWDVESWNSYCERFSYDLELDDFMKSSPSELTCQSEND